MEATRREISPNRLLTEGASPPAHAGWNGILRPPLGHILRDGL